MAVAVRSSSFQVNSVNWTATLTPADPEARIDERLISLLSLGTCVWTTWADATASSVHFDHMDAQGNLLRRYVTVNNPAAGGNHIPGSVCPPLIGAGEYYRMLLVGNVPSVIMTAQFHEFQGFMGRPGGVNSLNYVVGDMLTFGRYGTRR